MRQFLLLLVFVVSSLQAAETTAKNILVAMGDIGSMKSSLNGDAGGDVPVQAWSQLSDDQRKVLAPLGSEWAAPSVVNLRVWSSTCRF